jgi:hypothetical protein
MKTLRVLLAITAAEDLEIY